MTDEPRLCLASASPRRRELLAQLGILHVVAPADIDEGGRDGESPADYVVRMAREKAERVAADPARSRGLPVLGADTSVVLQGRVLGKPADAAESRAMLALLSDRTHEVLSAVTLLGAHGSASRLARTEVRFRRIEPAEAAAYWASGEPRDKAGGYAIQGRAAAFVAWISGSYSGVVGLPLFETAALLAQAGLLPWYGAPPDAGALVGASPQRDDAVGALRAATGRSRGVA
jgi:septum formation protein